MLLEAVETVLGYFGRLQEILEKIGNGDMNFEKSE